MRVVGSPMLTHHLIGACSLGLILGLLLSAGPVIAEDNSPMCLSVWELDHNPLPVMTIGDVVVLVDDVAGRLYSQKAESGEPAILCDLHEPIYDVKFRYVGGEQDKALLFGNLGQPSNCARTFLLWTDGTTGGTELLERGGGVTGSGGECLGFLNVQPVGLLANGVLSIRASRQGLDLYMAEVSRRGTTLVSTLGDSRDAWDMMVARNGVTTQERCYFGLFQSSYVNNVNIWSSDGTFGGTTLETSWTTYGSGPVPTKLFCIKDRCYCLASENLSLVSAETSMWRLSDATSRDAAYLGSLPVALNDTGPATALGERAIFIANSLESGTELWASDGTVSGTTVLKDIYPGSSSSDTSRPAVLGGLAYFGAFSPDVGWGLWRTDGTGQGTSLVMAVPESFREVDYARIDTFDAVGDLVYFQNAFVSSQGLSRELWRTDGTPEGTYRLCLLHPRMMENQDASWHMRANLDDVLYFTKKDDEHGVELWRTLGTVATTSLCEDILSGPADTRVSSPVLLGDKVVFTGLSACGDVYALWSIPHPFTRVPELLGLPRGSAVQKLAEHGLQTGRLSAQYDVEVARDIVVSQSPESATRVVRGTAVSLTISLGPLANVEGEGDEPPRSVFVPDYSGRSENGLESETLAAGLVLGRVSHVFSSSITAGTVVSQAPAAGTLVAENTAVDFVISCGPGTTGCASSASSPSGSCGVDLDWILLGTALLFMILLAGNALGNA